MRASKKRGKMLVDFHWEPFRLGHLHFRRLDIPHPVSGMPNMGAITYPLYNVAINNQTATHYVRESNQLNKG